ncbi:PREDICTED: SNF1-related protein kinase regulatory subunit gamma-1 [Tarenaya hassleriana]|uniref:SNF1-related protein kinase regulatory subunit gamma-1 n=1 Tax=Tarenaya hassleriana TaxID=28532 RepID=UPI00053C82E7|nr:PREDICTED: SNF1-related protein kinase regulatory subunit gamma-1 [Tarenaya hassleriana]
MASVPEIKIVRSESLSQRSDVSSPEAKLGMRVEDLWDVQEPQLSPTDKLNACFESIPVSAFPPAPACQDVEIKSDATLAEAVEILSKHKILSAPVVNVKAAEDDSWIDRYLGIVEFAGIVVWLLHQLEPPSPRSPSSVAAVNGTFHDAEVSGNGDSAVTSGNFFEALTSSELYKNTKVQDISGTFRWAPFLALQKENSFLTMLLLLSKYKMKSIPVVDLGEAKIENIITQSAVIHMLAECAGLHWFENWGTKTLSEVGLPIMSKGHMIKVYDDEPVLQVFKLMRKKRIGGMPVIDRESNKPLGNISLRDVHFLLTAPEIYHDNRSITAKNFLEAVREYLENHGETSAPMLSGVIACTKNHTLKELILMLDTEKIHRIYVVDEDGNLEGLITLRDIISRLVHEPPGYFGDFFDGVLPLPVNSRV